MWMVSSMVSSNFVLRLTSMTSMRHIIVRFLWDEAKTTILTAVEIDSQ